MLLLFIDLAVRLDANIEEDEEHVDDDAAIQALMAGAGEAQDKHHQQEGQSLPH